MPMLSCFIRLRHEEWGSTPAIRMAAPVSPPGSRKNFTCRLPKGLLEKLGELAKEKGLPRQDLITAILREWVEHNGPDDR